MDWLPWQSKLAGFTWWTLSGDAAGGAAVPAGCETCGSTEQSKLGKTDWGPDGAAAVQAKNIWLVSGATVTLKPDGTCHSSLQKLRRKKFALKLDSFFNESSRGNRLSICFFEKGARWSAFGIARDHTQCCPSVNQIPVTSQSTSEKNESGICWEKHGRGIGVRWCCRRTDKGLAAFTAGVVSIATISEKRPGLKLNYLLSGTW